MASHRKALLTSRMIVLSMYLTTFCLTCSAQRWPKGRSSLGTVFKAKRVVLVKREALGYHYASNSRWLQLVGSSSLWQRPLRRQRSWRPSRGHSLRQGFWVMTGRHSHTDQLEYWEVACCWNTGTAKLGSPAGWCRSSCVTTTHWEAHQRILE